jgi:hypothetical protein
MGDGVNVNTMTTVDYDMSRKLGVEYGTTVNLDQMFYDSEAKHAWMDEIAVDEIVVRTAGHVTPEEVMNMSAMDVLPRGLDRAIEILPRSWRYNPSLPAISAETE